MSAERIEVQRVIAVTPPEVFTVLCDPEGHLAIDSSGMLQSVHGDRVSGTGDTFVVHMDRQALGDLPLGTYDVTVVITRFVPDSTIEWTVTSALAPPIGHLYGYRVEPHPDGTLVTSYCDWSQVSQAHRQRLTFPVVPESSLRASLGILARTLGPMPAGERY
ncbi:MAG: SRPBCC family protein [Mycobacteriaceae bacterium]